MSGLLNGSIDWDVIADTEDGAKKYYARLQQDRVETARARAHTQALTEAAARMQPDVLEQTKALARLGLAARDLGHAIANNLRRLNTQEETTP
jgi:hypothetical protein